MESSFFKPIVIGCGDGLQAAIIPYGTRLSRLTVNVGGVQRREVLLGYSDFLDYKNDPYYMGAIVGRCANRIRGGQFNQDGAIIQLDQNEGYNHLHGGREGLHACVWNVEHQSGNSVTFKIYSPDGHMGYVGAAKILVTYTIDGNTLKVTLNGTVDQKTLLNLTSHGYFNLYGTDRPSMAVDQKVQINASHYTPMGNDQLPTGDLCALDGIDIDIRKPKTVKSLPDMDHNYMVGGEGLRQAAKLMCPDLAMEIWSTQPAMQFYSGHYLSGEFMPKSGICLEPQYCPDAVNQAAFKAPWVSPDRPYEEIIEFRFIPS